MKIAVACDKKVVTQHFGHCQNFNVYEVRQNKVIDKQVVPNPGHKPGFLPNYLNQLGVKVIIAGGMGGGAVDIFNDLGIEVIIGAKGEADTLVEAYLDNQLESTGSICHQHQNEDECN
ncbi:MAG: NifB/NifX family molybdenum-iron cluster-binding protein [Erysipelotrichaceae bacterium]|nr:NifB/NifX family molybdenum-iron cluster-binding protein [Erysipelotrichaceae bacterium]MDD3924092.1 NifB/NifX family molybdenum-iron cluster-binding protein [Erysipelotrichaceae bacterium]MDD4642264.1 NifB/NifX family molybdenum-iron cluster-binding protein [Erysipelotrichaceae bacterium]